MKIGILYTGGTIGCVGEPLAPLDEEKFEAAFQDIIAPIIHSKFPRCELCFIPFGPAVDSTNLQPRDWCDMAQDILPHYDKYDGFVVLHGTDTMAFSASALSFLFTGLHTNGYPQVVLSKPVVFTGAQLPIFHESEPGKYSLLFNTDALQNVCGAIAAARSGIPEVCLFFNDTLFRGNRTVKTNADEFHAFSSPNHPQLGKYGISFSIENDHILPLPTTQSVSLDSPGARHLLQQQLEYLTAHIDQTTVVPFRAFPGFYDRESGKSLLGSMLRAYVESMEIEGIILEAYGEGNFPSGSPNAHEKGDVYKVLQSAYRQGIVLIDCTQVLDGVVDADAYAAGSWLAEVGVVGAYDMTPIAALTKLIYLTTLKDYNGNRWSTGTIKRLMQTNLTGEVMDVNRLDTRGKGYLGAGECIEAFDGSATLINDFRMGPMLKDAKNKILWQALDEPQSIRLPGRLYMLGNGNLVFYDNSNTPVWSSNTAASSQSTSMLILNGRADPSGIKLYIYNYARGEVSLEIWPQGPIGSENQAGSGEPGIR